MKERSKRPLYNLIAVSLFFLLTGCQSAMSTSANAPDDAASSITPPPGHKPFTGTVADWPLWFIAHEFGAHCFNTQSCSIVYKGFHYGSDQPSPSVESYGRPLEKLLSAGRGPIPNFPPPAAVAWRSKDGTPLSANIDIGEIFKDRLIRHNLKREDISETSSISNPDIILEVNDRTIIVYMRAMIYLKKPRFKERPHSDYQDDLIQVFSRSY
jgi:hypothetical protein